MELFLQSVIEIVEYKYFTLNCIQFSCLYRDC